MKVLISCFSKSWGGLEMRTVQSAEELLKQNIKTEILCYPGSKIHSESLDKKIKVQTFKAAGYFHLLIILKLSKLLKAKGFDLIHTQYSKDLWVIVPALNLLKNYIPLILTKRLGSFVSKKDFLHKWIYNRVDKIIAISSVIKKNVLETCPVDENKISLIYNGVETEKYSVSEKERMKIRKEFDVKDDEILVGMTGRFTFGKGHEEFIDAAKNLTRNFNKLKFIIVGEASAGEKEYQERIHNLAGELVKSKKLIFTGYRQDIPSILSAIDIYVLPSHSEAFGVALIEAMAAGKPCISSNTDGVLDIITDNKNGLMFRSKDGKDLEDKIEKLVNDPTLRIRLAENAQRTVNVNFNLKNQTQKNINLYKELIKNER